ncbi:MAG: hypothetical protein ACOC2E_05445 [Bacteroidota bacterium]
MCGMNQVVCFPLVEAEDDVNEAFGGWCFQPPPNDQCMTREAQMTIIRYFIFPQTYPITTQS